MNTKKRRMLILSLDAVGSRDIERARELPGFSRFFTGYGRDKPLFLRDWQFDKGLWRSYNIRKSIRKEDTALCWNYIILMCRHC